MYIYVFVDIMGVSYWKCSFDIVNILLFKTKLAWA